MKFMNVIKNFKSRQDYVDYRNQMLDEAIERGKLELPELESDEIGGKALE